jgi:hypothetical protein
MRMSSTSARAKWLDHHREVVREIRPDRDDADAKLRLAQRNLERARVNAEGDPDPALVAAESALVNVPQGMTRISSPNNSVLVLGRTLVETDADVSAAYALSKQIHLTPLGG